VTRVLQRLRPCS